ncbi:hypothetical protein GOP47_0004251 [Adiantum capillus-veneris]|uniref:Uncharacterized protein n=1 Tax=Adiantum capillus-veneris TaxID=13818 RepID=A0A9D4ZMF1_ADICA|nr:hypothetical protein GOP47_0004251 [Adiantum capillus-veneris]
MAHAYEHHKTVFSFSCETTSSLKLHARGPSKRFSQPSPYSLLLVGGYRRGTPEQNLPAFHSLKQVLLSHSTLIERALR